MSKLEQEMSDGFTLQYLGKVLNVLLDPSKKIVDDTSLQRLLEYCKTIFSHEDICKQEDGLKHVFDFLEACCNKEPHEFDPCALTFALQLVRSLSSNQKLLNQLITSHDDQSNSKDGVLLVRLLKRACGADFFADPCMKEAWLIALHTLSYSKMFWTMCIQTDALRIAMDLLKDTSMFVVKSSQRFLARILILKYKQDGQETSSMKNTVQDSLQDGSSKMADCEGSSKMVPSEGVIQEDQDIRLNGDDAGDDGNIAMKRKLCEVNADGEIDNVTQKKSRLSAKPKGDAVGASDLEVIHLCDSLMESKEAASILASLLLDLEACRSHQETIFQVSQSSDSERKTIQSLGVFRCILKETDEGELESRGLHLLRDVAMVTRCKQLLCKEGPVCDKLCEDVVEFVGCLLQIESKKCKLLTSSLVSDLESLPHELIKKGVIKHAIHLAFSIVKICSILPQSRVIKFLRPKDDPAHAMTSSLSVILGPVCVITERSPLKPDLSLDQDVLQEFTDRMTSGRQVPLIICTALSALGDLVKEDCCLHCLPASNVFHLAVALLHAFTPNTKTTSQSKSLKVEYKSLIGSRRIVSSLLDLAQVSLKGACVSSDIWLFVDLINTTLKDPDAEYKVILKILTIVPDLVAIAMETTKHPVFIENTKRDALMMEVGYALQKRMCNIEWEIRDSTIACVGKLLQKQSDNVRGWLQRNNLHRRLWESLEDSESYVRASSLQALPVLVSCKGLWEDVMSSCRITQVELVGKIAEIIKSDSEAFPRRAAIGCLLTWVKQSPWLQESIDLLVSKGRGDTSSSLSLQDIKVSKVLDSPVVSPQDSGDAGDVNSSSSSALETDPAGPAEEMGSKSQELKSPENKMTDERFVTVAEMIRDAVSEESDGKSEAASSTLPPDPEAQDQKKPMIKVKGECRSVGVMVLDAVSIAMSDFDWEMKLCGLEFFHLLLSHYVPGYDLSCASSSVDLSCSMNRTRIERILEGKETKEVVSFFSRTGCLARLIGGSRDEDVSVARRAYEMLQSLKIKLHDLFEKSECAAQTGQEGRTVDTVCSVNKDNSPKNEQTTNETNHNQESNITSITETNTPLTATHSDTPTCTLINVSDSKSSMSDLIGQLFNCDWIDLLKHREADNVEGPVSLMMDILAAADEKDENLLDCY